MINKVKDSLLSAVRPTIKTTLWLLKIMIPVTLAVAILNYFGIIEQISIVATPLFSIMGLDGKAAIAFVTSLFTNLYAVIGVMSSLSLDFRTVTILATMCLISHNLIVECKIQQKSGSPIFFIATLRVITSIVSGILLNLILPTEYNGMLIMPVASESYTNFSGLLIGWLKSSLLLSTQVLIIIYVLNFIQKLLRAYKIIEKLQYPLSPIMKILGLPSSTSILWIIANTLGLTYGGMAIVEELDKGYVSQEDARLLNSSIAVTHSLLEDSLVFIAIGVPFFLVILPRFILSIVIVAAHKFFRSRFKLSYL